MPDVSTSNPLRGMTTTLEGKLWRLDVNQWGHQRFVVVGECWVWSGCKRKGYGRLFLNGRNYTAHRVYYEALHGPILEGMTLDHLCNNSACVRPAHMRPCTIRENVKRRYEHARC